MQEPIRNSGAVSTDNQSKLHPKLKGVSIAQLNITSLTKHIDELRILITEMNFDILCINETRIDKTIKNSEIGLQGYDLTRRDRNRRGGGVAIYIRNTIPYVERSTIIPENVEAVCIEVRKPNAKPILISTWYRPPNSNSEILDSFEIFLQNIDTENKEIIITGDFNIDLMPSETENSKAKRLKELLNTYQLSQLIKKPTRTTESTKTLLDLVICKTDDPKPATTDVVELGISDHNLVYTCRKVGICKQKPKIIETRQYHKLNNAKFQNDLKQALLHINEHSDPNTALQEWNRIFLLIADINAPIRLRKVRSDRQPWMTDEIKKLIMSFHRDYIKKKAVMLNSSAFHSDINIANTINNYFVEIGPKLASVISPTDIDPIQPIQPCRCEFNLRAITTTELIQTIGKTNLNKAPGLDKIPIKLIKLAGDAIHDYLLHIFNLVLGTGIFPDDLKLAKIIPIHKEGDKAECGNYRPISVIPTVAKILEKIIYDQLSSYINDNDIICKQQFGFRPNHSTETALLKCTDQWLLNMDKGMANGVLFLNLKKAFDTVDHSILLQKLYQYGIKGTPLKLLASYLNNRKQVCVINNNKSGQETVQCRVPQGSNLGPLLFSLYINDLPMCLEYTQASMFADDTNLSCTGRTPAEIEHKLNADLSNVNDWLEANRLTLNTDKTEFMIIASKRKLNQFRTDIRIHINGSIIKQVKQKKTLANDIFSCNFDGPSRCKWTQDSNDDFNWTRHEGPTHSFDTGPARDHTKTYLTNKTQGPGSLRHRSGKCIHILMEGSSRPNDGENLVLYRTCGKDRLEFLLWPNGTLMHTRHRMCVKPIATGPLTDGVKVGVFESCEVTDKWTWTAHGALQYKNIMCLKPETGGSNPSNNVKLVLDSACNLPESQNFFEFVPYSESKDHSLFVSRPSGKIRFCHRGIQV
ncbi:RNA-directed DNA polymerase from mobile element jockey [Paramuricea clavata]|uniref:RNA-directed DNA polymerase from mobile element jockey n=1 Tax=Paramuricea clavata TaxID=317549 RepID=A0A6S7GVF2_PARCT|nr:RNA-directed DNA polymerase from mobile element jockey [Paramuricea clavata]